MPAKRGPRAPPSKDPEVEARRKRQRDAYAKNHPVTDTDSSEPSDTGEETSHGEDALHQPGSAAPEGTAGGQTPADQGSEPTGTIPTEEVPFSPFAPEFGQKSNSYGVIDDRGFTEKAKELLSGRPRKKPRGPIMSRAQFVKTAKKLNDTARRSNWSSWLALTEEEYWWFEDLYDVLLDNAPEVLTWIEGNRWIRLALFAWSSAGLFVPKIKAKMEDMKWEALRKYARAGVEIPPEKLASIGVTPEEYAALAAGENPSSPPAKSALQAHPDKADGSAPTDLQSHPDKPPA